jgi:hypothetical protein
MIHATDSFITYLATELNNDPPVRWVRVTTSDEQSASLAVNTCNVSILAIDQYGSVEEALVSLDVIGTDERTVWRWIGRIRDVLLQTLYTPEYDYSTTPGTPVSRRRMVTWDRDDVEFSAVGSGDSLLQFNATFPIRHVRQ